MVLMMLEEIAVTCLAFNIILIAIFIRKLSKEVLLLHDKINDDRRIINDAFNKYFG